MSICHLFLKVNKRNKRDINTEKIKIKIGESFKTAFSNDAGSAFAGVKYPEGVLFYPRA